ncbi:hypothetical protein JXA32_06380 [Candidatus Sumerlaeota bacterium]|nr:hypothetical protein [Candidatus Sumerlaeota bacterium]
MSSLYGFSLLTLAPALALALNQNPAPELEIGFNWLTLRRNEIIGWAKRHHIRTRARARAKKDTGQSQNAPDRHGMMF